MTKAEEKRQQEAGFKALYDEAIEAAREACKDVPDKGPCGWAKVRIKSNEPFARWVRKNGFGEAKNLGSLFGHGTWISDEYTGQALEGSRLYCKAFAEVLEEAGIDAMEWSWYD